MDGERWAEMEKCEVSVHWMVEVIIYKQHSGQRRGDVWWTGERRVRSRVRFSGPATGSLAAVAVLAHRVVGVPAEGSLAARPGAHVEPAAGSVAAVVVVAWRGRGG